MTLKVRRMRKLYSYRRGVLRDEMEYQCAGVLERVESDGGMHSVFLLPEGMDDTEVCRSANAGGLGILPLSTCYSGSKKQHGLIVGFAAHDEAAIQRGVSIIARCIKT